MHVGGQQTDTLVEIPISVPPHVTIDLDMSCFNTNLRQRVSVAEKLQKRLDFVLAAGTYVCTRLSVRGRK